MSDRILRWLLVVGLFLDRAEDRNPVLPAALLLAVLLVILLVWSQVAIPLMPRAWVA